MSLNPIAPALPLAEQVANALRAAILTGHLPPGERLSVPEVARRMAVSRTPAREAMLILEREGLIVTRPRLGAVVAQGSNTDLADMLDIREALDGMAARLAATRMGPDEKHALALLLEEHDSALEAEDIERHIQLDLEFHRRLGAYSGNQRLGKALIDLERQIQLLMNTTSTAPGFVGRAVMRDHGAVVRAVIAGDADAAERAARAHVNRIRRFCAQLAGKSKKAAASTKES